MKKAKRAVAAMCIMALGYGFWWCSMNYAGYCHAQNRFLTDQEKIDAGIQYALNRYPPSIRSTRIEVVNGIKKQVTVLKVPEHPVKYRDVAEFKTMNPNCCYLAKVVGEDGLRHPWIDRVSGYFADFAIMSYKIRYMEDGQEKYAAGGMSVSIANCGRAWSMF